MAVAFRSVGAFGKGLTSATAAVPTGGGAPQSGDLLLIVLESADAFNVGGTPNTPSGWTKLFEETQDEGNNGATTLTIFGKIAGASESDVTIDGVLNHVSCQMICYSGTRNVVTDVQVGTGNGASTGNGTALGVTTPENNCLVLAVFATGNDNDSTTNFSSFTNSNLSSITERLDQGSKSGSGGGIGLAEGLKASAGATGDTTVTIAVSDKWRGVHLVLRPAATGISGTASITQDSNTSSAAGTVALKGTSSVTQANNTSTATGAIALKGTFSVTQDNNTSVATGAIALKGTLSLTQAGDTLAATGGANALNGVSNITQADNTIIATGKVSLSGIVNITQANNTLSASGDNANESEPEPPMREDHDSQMGIHWVCLPRRRTLYRRRGRIIRI